MSSLMLMGTCLPLEICVLPTYAKEYLWFWNVFYANSSIYADIDHLPNLNDIDLEQIRATM